MAGEWEFGFVRSPFGVFKLNSPEANNQMDRNYFNAALWGHRRGSTRCGWLVGSGCGICLACAWSELQTQWISPIFISTRHEERFVKFCNSHWKRRKKLKWLGKQTSKSDLLFLLWWKFIEMINLIFSAVVNFYLHNQSRSPFHAIFMHATAAHVKRKKKLEVTRPGLPLMTKACQPAVALDGEITKDRLGAAW